MKMLGRFLMLYSVSKFSHIFTELEAWCILQPFSTDYLNNFLNKSLAIFITVKYTSNSWATIVIP
jgi:hypothetical protein